MNPAEPSPMQTAERLVPHADVNAMPTLGLVVARMAAEVAVPLTAALDRVLALASSGRIDRPGLQALRSEIDDARRVGLRGQQIVRFASGEVRQHLERLDLAELLRQVLDHHALQHPGTPMGGRTALGAAEVMGDASLVHAVLQAAAEWSGAHARAGIDWRLDIKPWPAHARVACHFAHQPADQAPEAVADAAKPAAFRESRLDTLDWLLLQYTAHIAGVSVRRQDSRSHSTLTLEFQHTINVTLEGASAVDLSAADVAAPSLSGSQVLVLAARRETRQGLREALQGQDLLIDYVSTVSAAAQYCEGGAPQLLVYESSFDGDALWALRVRLSKLLSGVAMIEVLPSGQQCEMGDGTPESVTRLGADGLRHMLPSMITLEMARRRQL